MGERFGLVLLNGNPYGVLMGGRFGLELLNGNPYGVLWGRGLDWCY